MFYYFTCLLKDDVSELTTTDYTLFADEMSRLAGQLRKLSTTAMRSWNESDILIDRKSKFQARCCEIKSQTEINDLLEKLIQSDKRIAKASHPHMFAWRTGITLATESTSRKLSKRGKKSHSFDAKFTNIEQGSSDGGESGAGQRLLTLLEQANVVNVLVIVTRWYGGTPLGSSRFRHISSTAVESLKKGGFLP